MTEDSENVFANALPYLRSVPSPGDELAKDSGWGKTSWEWNREFTAPQLGDYLRSRGVNVGTPQRVECQFGVFEAVFLQATITWP